MYIYIYIYIYIRSHLLLRMEMVREGVNHASIRQHKSAYVSIRRGSRPRGSRIYIYTLCQHTSAYVSIRQHTSAYVSIRQHTSAYVVDHVYTYTLSPAAAHGDGA
jgi:hypothetical protein